MPRGIVLKDPFVSINGVDLSAEVRQVEVQMSQPGVASTASGAGGTEAAPGLREDSFTVRLRQKFGAGAVDSTLFPLFDDAAEFPVIVRHSQAVISEDNPSYTGTCFLEEYPPFTQEVGALAETTISLPVQGKIARAII